VATDWFFSIALFIPTKWVSVLGLSPGGKKSRKFNPSISAGTVADPVEEDVIGAQDDATAVEDQHYILRHSHEQEKLALFPDHAGRVFGLPLFSRQRLVDFG
jgi:hypothetical protein